MFKAWRRGVWPDDDSGVNITTTTPPKACTNTWQSAQTQRKQHLHDACANIENNGGLKDIEDSGAGASWSGQFLVSEQYKYMYCNLAKVASSSLKMALAKIGNSSAVAHSMLTSKDAIHLKKTLARAGIEGLEQSTPDDIVHKLMAYTKFLFIRHPIERLISAFRDKLEDKPPTSSFMQMYGNHIIKTYRRDDVDRTMTTTTTGRSGVTFAEFVQYVLVERPWNPHWNAFHHVCRPCFIPYDYIGKVEHMADDTGNIFAAIFGEDVARTAMEHFPRNNLGRKNKTSGEVAAEYLGQVSCVQLRELYDMYADDLRLFDYKPIGMDVCSNTTV